MKSKDKLVNRKSKSKTKSPAPNKPARQSPVKNRATPTAIAHQSAPSASGKTATAASKPLLTPEHLLPTVEPELTPATSETNITAKVDVGFGNQLYIRGQGDNLSWDKGQPLQCRNADTWLWSTPHATGKIQFKLLLNDQWWCDGPDYVAEAGATTVVTPKFAGS